MSLIDSYVSNISNSSNQVKNKYPVALNKPQDNKPMLDTFKKTFDENSSALYSQPLAYGNYSLTGRLLNILPVGFSLAHITFGLLNKITNYQGIKSKFLIFSAIELAGTFIAGKLLSNYFAKVQNENLDKNIDKLNKYFDKINDTSAHLSEKPIYSNKISAFYNGANGKISFNKKDISDPIIYNLLTKYTLKHELVHAKQFETIARSKDGIAKINYIFIKENEVQLNNPEVKKYYQQAITEINSGLSDKYKNMKISKYGYEFNLVDFINAVWTLHTNKDIKLTELPIIIDKEHYQKVIDDNPPLTLDEEKKAEEYFKSACEYKMPDNSDILNTESDYYQNVLEKEANQAFPWYIRCFLS